MGYLTLNIDGSGGNAGPTFSGGGSDLSAGDVVFGSLDTNAGAAATSGSNKWLGIGLVTAAIIAGYLLGRQ